MKPAGPVRTWLAALACGWLHLSTQAQAAAPAQQPEPEFVYRFQARDTLIGLSRRLLLQPGRWPDVQALNRIPDPFRILPDTPIRIPYSWLRLRPDTAQVLTVTGTVTRGGAAVAAGEVLAEGTVIETGDDGSATLSFADGSTVTVQKSSVLRLEHLQQVEGAPDGHSTRLRLDSGRIETTVQPKRDVGRFEIVTPVAVSAVRGTRFRNSFEADGDAHTETLEGTVGVTAQDGAATVPAGFGTRVAASGVILPPVALLPAPDLSAVPQTHGEPVLQLEFPAVPGAATYRVQVAADADFQTLTFDNESAASAATIGALPDGEYWLRARAIDGFGIEGRDATRQITQRLLPAAPALLAPQAAARVIGTAGTYEWASVPGAARYRLQLARDAAFTDLATDREITGATRVTLEDELPAGSYHWRVASLDAAGAMGEWSPPQSHLQRPQPVTVEQPVVTRRQVQLHWPARPGETWRVQVARDAQFRRLLVDQQTDAAELVIRKPVPGTYHVRVQALGEGAGDPFGEPRSFGIELPRWLKLTLPLTVLLPLLP